MAFPPPEVLLSVDRPGRYVGGEYGCVSPAERREPIARACFVFPDVYEIGMSHLGLRILAAEVNAEPDLLAERAFAPWPDMAEALESARSPLVSLESGCPLSAFDVVGVTLPHELAAATLLRTLRLGGIPVLAADRTDDDPIVIGGGGWATHPAAVEPYLDAVFVGDAEGAVAGLIRGIGEARRRGERRGAILGDLGRRPEVLVPSLREADGSAAGARAVRRIAADAPSAAPFASGPVPSVGTVFDRVTIELARGCGGGCRFCQAGYTYRPERHRGADAAVAEIAASLRHTGCDEIALSALSTADYPELPSLVDRLARFCDDRHIALGISSLRAYGLPDAVLAVIARTRRTGLTLAPEAGTQRLRDVISKRVAEQDIVDAVRRVAAAGWRRVKLYFMIGLPTETDEDVAGIADLARRVAAAGRAAAAGGRFLTTVSVSNFVPKPHTPFQWEPMLPLDEIDRRQDLLRRRLRGGPIELRLHDGRTSVLECLLGRGGPEAARAVLEAHRRGAYLDAWTEHFDWTRWTEALAAAGMSPADAARPLDPDAPAPWSHVDVSISPKFLRRERERAYEARPTGRCDPAPDRFRCDYCGVGCKPPPAAPAATPEGGIAPATSSFAVDAVSRSGAVGHGDVAGRARSGTTPSGPVEHMDERAVWCRVVVRKAGRAIYLGHLDFTRALARAFRRADLPVSYTRGFHPAPRIVLATPLPLGAVGLAEPGDVRMDECPDDLPIRIADLRTRLPHDIDLLDLRVVGKDNPRLTRLVARAEYALAAPAMDERAARRAAETAAGWPEWPIGDPRRKNWRGRDARPFVALLEPVPLRSVVGSLAPDPAAWGLRVHVTVAGGCPPIRPLAALLLGEREVAVSIYRVALLDPDGVPLT